MSKFSQVPFSFGLFIVSCFDLGCENSSHTMSNEGVLLTEDVPIVSEMIVESQDVIENVHSGEAQEQFVELSDFPNRPSSDSYCINTCDTLQLLDVEYYDGSLGIPKSLVDTIERQVASGGCDATLIGPDLAILSAHCSPTVGSNFPFFNQRRNPSGVIGPIVNYPVTEVLEQGSGSLDYAIVRLGPQGGNLPGNLYGFARIAAIPLAPGELLPVVHGPGSTTEKFEVATFVGINPADGWFGYTNFHSRPGSSGAGVRDAVGFLHSVHGTGECGPGECKNAWGVPFYSVLWNASPIVRNIAAVYAIGGNGFSYAKSTNNLFALNNSTKEVLKYNGSPYSWTPIGTSALQLYTGGNELYARITDHSIYRYTSGSNWSLVSAGVSGDSYVVSHQGTLFRLNAAKTMVHRWTGSAWSQIGGAASKLFQGVDTVYAANSANTKVNVWSGTGMVWAEVSNGVNELDTCSNGSIYKRVGKLVYRLVSGTWTQIGDNAASIECGNSALYARFDNNKVVSMYRPSTGTWTWDARSASVVVGSKSGEYYAVDLNTGHLLAYRISGSEF